MTTILRPAFASYLQRARTLLRTRSFADAHLRTAQDAPLSRHERRAVAPCAKRARPMRGGGTCRVCGGWVVFSCALALAALATVMLALAQPLLAHDQKPPPPLALLPACRVERTSCSYADLSRRDWGSVRPFPPTGDSPLSFELDELQIREEFEPLTNIPCTGGFAGVYPCQHVDLLAFLPVTLFGDHAGNTLWGWVDPVTGQEYVILGLRNGSAFVEISDPINPRFVGKLPTHTGDSHWRDMKVYGDYAYIVADKNGTHGMQIFDMTHLRTLTGTTPVTLTADAHYDGFRASHNIVINEESGFLYAVGTETCNGGLHIVDIRTPTDPVFAGCYTTDGYVHDAQCVIYRGPDGRYTGRELCFNASAAQLTVVDVTDKSAPVRLSTTVYSGLGYVHQGWLTGDQRYQLVNDELDERMFFHNARTYVFDMIDLAEPKLVGYYEASNPAVDHNLYIRGTLIYEANYTSGLRILETGNLARARMREVGYFDTYPGSDAPEFTGAWSPFPFFPSGVVAVSTIDRGLFLLRPNIPDEPYEDLEVFLPLVQGRE
jgi:choice-of-anchor B domain-containing protein